MNVRRLGRDEIDVFRSLRLAALAGDPDAFSSDLARESAFTDRDWARGIAGSAERRQAVFAAFGEEGPIGMAGVGDADDGARIWGMWVDPRARRSGAGRALVDAAVTWARSVGAPAVSLWVMGANTAAIELYRRCGFETVTEGAPPPPPGCADERFMRRPL